MKFCEECGAQLEDDVLFCDECGTPVSQDVEDAVVIAVPPVTAESNDTPNVRFCEECGAQLAEDEMFCSECGTSVDISAEDVVVVPPVINAEVKPQEERQEEPQEISQIKKKFNPKLFIGIGAGVVVVALIVAVVILAAKLVQKDNEGMSLVGDDETTTYEVAENETTTEDVTTEVVTTEVVTTEEPTTEDTTDYTWYEEFIELVGSLSDWPILSEEAMEEYQKGLYKSWINGDDFKYILIGPDGKLHIDMFWGHPYGIYTVTGTTDCYIEFEFQIIKDESGYSAKFTGVNETPQEVYSLQFNNDVFFDFYNIAKCEIDLNYGGALNITFIPQYNGVGYLHVNIEYYDVLSYDALDEWHSQAEYADFDNYDDFYDALH